MDEQTQTGRAEGPGILQHRFVRHLVRQYRGTAQTRECQTVHTQATFSSSKFQNLALCKKNIPLRYMYKVLNVDEIKN